MKQGKRPAPSPPLEGALDPPKSAPPPLTPQAPFSPRSRGGNDEPEDPTAHGPGSRAGCDHQGVAFGLVGPTPRHRHWDGSGGRWEPWGAVQPPSNPTSPPAFPPLPPPRCPAAPAPPTFCRQHLAAAARNKQKTSRSGGLRDLGQPCPRNPPCSWESPPTPSISSFARAQLGFFTRAPPPTHPQDKIILIFPKTEEFYSAAEALSSRATLPQRGGCLGATPWLRPTCPLPPASPYIHL